MVSFAEGIQSCVAREIFDMAETGTEDLAGIVAKGRILLVPSTQSFLYQGFSDKQHVITLLPTETCPCSASECPELSTAWQLYWPLAEVWTVLCQ